MEYISIILINNAGFYCVLWMTISKNGCQIWVRLTNLFYTLNVGSLFGFTHSADWTDFDWYIGIGNDEINNFLCCFSNIFRLIHFLSEHLELSPNLFTEDFCKSPKLFALSPNFFVLSPNFFVLSPNFFVLSPNFFVYSVLFEGTIYPVAHLLNRYPSVSSSIQIINVV